MANKVNLAAKLDAFDDHWSPKIVGHPVLLPVQ